MQNRLIITFDSSQCTGKTTLINALKEKYKIFNIQKEPVRGLIKNKDKVNFADDKIQLSILSKQRNYILDNDYVLQDRSPLSSFSYTKYLRSKGLSNINDSFYRFIEEESKLILQSDLIDYIVVLPIEFPLIDDGFRTLSYEQQSEIQEIINNQIKSWGIEDKVLRPSGSVDERVEFLSRYIDLKIKN